MEKTDNNSGIRDFPILGIILPCFNEEEILDDTFKKICDLLENLMKKNIISRDSFAAFVDDGSIDNSWTIIETEVKQNTLFKGLKLSGNVGHQRALLSGLLTYNAEADVLITIDADLQDDISVIEEMVLLYNQGHDIVYGIRKKRKVDTFFKLITAKAFYALMKSLGVNTVYNHADFRLASNKVIVELERFEESNLFLRGIFPIMGFKSGSVYYDRLERFAGDTKFPLKKMVSFAWEGITSFSIQPLRIVTVLGVTIFVISLFLSGYAIVSYLMDRTIHGWVSTVLPMYFLGGIQLLCIGIIGEYIGKIYQEVKRRPRYIIEKKI